MVGSPTVSSYPTRMRPFRKVTRSLAFKRKPTSSSNPIDHIKGINALEDSAKSRDSLISGIRLSLTSISKHSFLQMDATLFPSLLGLESKNARNISITVGDDLLLAIEAVRCSVATRGLKFLSNLLDLTMMDKSIDLCC